MNKLFQELPSSVADMPRFTKSEDRITFMMQMIHFYISDPDRRALTSGVCTYETPISKKHCGVGWCLPQYIINEMHQTAGNCHVDLEMYEKKLITRSVNELKDLEFWKKHNVPWNEDELDFLGDVQGLHDTPDYYEEFEHQGFTDDPKTLLQRLSHFRDKCHSEYDDVFAVTNSLDLYKKQLFDAIDRLKKVYQSEEMLKQFLETPEVVSHGL